MVDRNELWAQAEELADLLLQCPEIQAYKDAEMTLQSHPEAQAMMRRLRELQEEIAEFAAREVPEQYYVHLTQESESIFEKMEKIPEVTAFLEAQNALNELLQSVTGRLSDAVQRRVVPTPEGG